MFPKSRPENPADHRDRSENREYCGHRARWRGRRGEENKNHGAFWLTFVAVARGSVQVLILKIGEDRARGLDSHPGAVRKRRYRS